VFDITSLVASLANGYQLLGFLIVGGLQVYTRLAVAKLAKNQEVFLARHDASRAEVLRLAEHAYAQMTEKSNIRPDDVAATIQAALRVAYFQGQADVGTDRTYPEERAKAATETLVNIAMQAARDGHGKTRARPPAPES
jgi:hypothetical protein